MRAAAPSREVICAIVVIRRLMTKAALMMAKYDF